MSDYEKALEVIEFSSNWFLTQCSILWLGRYFRFRVRGDSGADLTEYENDHYDAQMLGEWFLDYPEGKILESEIPNIFRQMVIEKTVKS